MVDATHIGFELKPVTGRVEPGRLRFFRKTVDPDDSTTEVVPPSYLFSLSMLDAENPFDFIDEIGVPLASVLHADQTFKYHAPVKVDDQLTFRCRVADVFDKKSGALTFVVQEIRIENQDQVHVADMQRTLVVRNGQVK